MLVSFGAHDSEANSGRRPQSASPGDDDQAVEHMRNFAVFGWGQAWTISVRWPTSSACTCSLMPTCASCCCTNWIVFWLVVLLSALHSTNSKAFGYAASAIKGLAFL